ncbi:MAG: hypothetical protein H0T42_15150 [Deltaproteobacteria bacterium]|nr:hypothetical protein [Deltaproteobacteria bacterium]
MSGPQRTKGETLPVMGDELDRLKKQTQTSVPVVRSVATAANKNVVPAKRANTAHGIVPPPPDRAGDGDDDDEVVIEMSAEDDVQAPHSHRAKSETLADPTTTERLAEAARRAPAPAPAAAPNRHVKRRDS